jgi:hypothetical protein
VGVKIVKNKGIKYWNWRIVLLSKIALRMEMESFFGENH